MIAVIILISLSLINLGMDISEHGKVVTKEKNAWVTLLSMIVVFILYYYAFK